MSEQTTKQNFNIRTTPEAAELLKEMSRLAKRDFGDEFEIIMRAEWDRRKSLETPTTPIAAKRNKS